MLLARSRRACKALLSKGWMECALADMGREDVPGVGWVLEQAV